MQTQSSFSVDDAVAFLFPEDNFVTAFQKDKFPPFNQMVLPSFVAGPDTAVSEDVWDFSVTMNTEPIRAHRACFDTADDASEATADEYSSSEAASDGCSSPSAQKAKKRLVAWTHDEHERFVVALERLRTEDTESYNRHGKKTRGLGPGIADLIALAVRTRTAAQVRSHAQKYFAKQRKEMGLPLW